MAAQPKKQIMGIEAIKKDCLNELQILFMELRSVTKHHAQNFSRFNVFSFFKMSVK